MQIYSSLQTDNHASSPTLSVLQASCPFCHPTNSVKALKAYNCLHLFSYNFMSHQEQNRPFWRYSSQPKMLKLKHTKKKSNPKPARKFKKCSHVCRHHCAQLSYKTQHIAVLIIFRLSYDVCLKVTPGKHHSSDTLYWRTGGHILHMMS